MGYCDVVPYQLEVVKAHVQGARDDRKRLRYYVENTIEMVACRLDCTIPQAREVIREGLLRLTALEYRGTIPTPPPPADVYDLVSVHGIEGARIAWYVKFKVVPLKPVQPVEPEHLLLCSYHP